MAPKHNYIIAKSLVMMLKAGIINLASSAWLLSVLVVMNEDRKPSFCPYYLVLNQKRKVNLFTLLFS